MPLSSAVHSLVVGAFALGLAALAQPAPNSQTQGLPRVTPTASTTEPGPVFGLGPQGFLLGSPASGFQLRLRGVVQADGRAYPDSQPMVPSTFLIRRARLYIEGTVGDFADYRLLPDFGQGQLQLQDAWIDFRPFGPWVKLRVGKMKTPFGLERLIYEQNLVFIERGLPSDLTPDRDIGASLHGNLGNGAVIYELAVLNGTVDNGSNDGDLDNEKDTVARLFVNPLRPLTSFPAARNFGIGAAGTWGNQFGTPTTTLLPTYKTSAQTTFFSYLIDSKTPANSVYASGEHRRFSPQAYEYLGPLGVLAEFVWDQQQVQRLATRSTLIHRAWQIELNWVLTGERPTIEGFVPKHPFSVRQRQWGAVELVGRYGELKVDPAAFPRFADPTKSAREADSWTLGANWHLTSNVKLALNFERTFFTGGAVGGNLAPQSALLGRVQLAF